MNVFRGRFLPEPAQPAGYAALIEQHGLRVPLPPRMAAVAERHHPQPDEQWLLLTPRHRPTDSLGGHLEFAVKWEGVNLSVLSALFQSVSPQAIAGVIHEKPTGIYTRRLWFLYEWLTGRKLDLPDSGKVRSVPAIDPKQQFAARNCGLSSRHAVTDNLPGAPGFCPMVRRTDALVRFEGLRLDLHARRSIRRVHPDLLSRAAAFLLMDDSRASFRIEGERPSRERAARWAQAIAEAGSHRLSVEELERLQHIVIGDARFVRLGVREEGGFVGSHDRRTGEPIPEHISARPQDLLSLLQGVIRYGEKSIENGMDPVVAAAALAFGFVYVHPFEDGNGRLHRWLVHHVLAAAGYAPPGVVFPISAAILRNMAPYREVLESYSKPLLQWIEWRPTESGNVEVLNDTTDYYRFFDATAHAEFLYRCVEETVERDIPGEVAYLEAYDRFTQAVQDIVDMPDRTVDLLQRFLRRGQGRLSKRARAGEFSRLTDEEAARLERLYMECFGELTLTSDE